MKITNIESIDWHDGILETMSVEKDFVISVLIYSTEDAKSRSFLKLQFKGVKSILFTCDKSELEINLNAGNISNGYVKKNNSGAMIFRLYLVDGYIEVTYETVIITENE